MRKNLKTIFASLLCAAAATFFLLAALYTNSFFAPANAQSDVPLFSLGETVTQLVENEKSSLAAISETRINFNVLNAAQLNVKQLSFVLPDGKLRVAIQNNLEGFEERGKSEFTWRGKLEENNLSGDVILTFGENSVSGLIYAGDAVYEIVTRDEQQILVELAPNKFPDCAGEIRSPKVENKFFDSDTFASDDVRAADTGNTIDVLVLYSSNVRNSLGGDAQARTFAQQAIDSTNTAYINSRITQRVRLVNAQLSPVAETGSLSSELSNLRNNSTATSLRNQYRADLVAMLSNSSDGCGIGYLMGGTGGNANNAFTVTSRSCAVGNLSFAHELGHNMGSAHNPENGSGGTYSYSYGHWINGSFRTVMSYSNPCSSGCTRRAYFSNPSVSYNGSPTGISTRDNARSINNTDTVIANYRSAGN